MNISSSGQQAIPNEEIYLTRKNLSTIPDSIFALKTIKYLDLGAGWIRMPEDGGKPAIDNRNHIKYISNKIRNLKLLEVLDLSFNDINDLPDEFSELKNLTVLSLAHNENFNLLKNLPILKKLKKLTRLNLIGIQTAEVDKQLIQKELNFVEEIWFTMSDVPTIDSL